MATYCEECDHARKTGPWHQWGCGKFPRLIEDGFVTKELRETSPYMLCKNINGGSCSLFKPIAKGGKSDN